MKKYIKDSIIKLEGDTRLNCELIVSPETIVDGIVVPAVIRKFVILNPTEEDFINNGWVEYDDSVEDTVDSVKDNILTLAAKYGSSKEVDNFTYQGIDMWLDGETRLKVYHSTNIKISEGIEITELSYNYKSYEIPCSLLIMLLNKLELYADGCHNTTEKHCSNILELKTIEELKVYDYKSGYPEKLNI